VKRPSRSKKLAAETFALRITVVDPPPNILWALQLSREEIVKPTSSTKTRISFDFTVEVIEASSTAGFRLRGPAVQGRPGEGFVYLRMGAYAGQVGIAAGWRAVIRSSSTQVILRGSWMGFCGSASVPSGSLAAA
jgi:hypothetical protein